VIPDKYLLKMEIYGQMDGLNDDMMMLNRYLMTE
jgi:hypothetical protein